MRQRNGIELGFAYEQSKEGRKLEKGKERKKTGLSHFDVGLRCVALSGNNRAKLPNRAYGVSRIRDEWMEWNGMGYLQSTGFINRHLATIVTSDTGMCDGMDGWTEMDEWMELHLLAGYTHRLITSSFFPLGVRIAE